MLGKLSAIAALCLGLAHCTPGRRPVELIDPVSRYANRTLELPAEAFPALQVDFEYPPDCGEQTYRGSGRLQGLKALITGGDSGMGRAIAIAYAREGAEVAINYLPGEEEDARLLYKFLRREGHRIHRIPGDLTSEEFCGELITEAHNRLNGLDILVNHAGYSGPVQGPNYDPITSFNTTDLHRIFTTNVFASLWLTRAAVPLLPRGGSIIFTSSALAANPVANSVLYGASKAAVSHTVGSLAQQLRPAGIRVNGVAPPLTYTPFIVTGGFTTEMLSQIGDVLPLGRIAQPAEISPHYVDLADPSKTHTSGEVFAALGGAPSL